MDSVEANANMEENHNNVSIRAADSLDNEFRYYCKVIQELVLLLTKQQDRNLVAMWVTKLSTPAYNVCELRDKRNRYMLMLCMSLMLDSLEGPFVSSPPYGILEDLIRIERPKFVTYEWEVDTTWEDQFKKVEELDVDSLAERNANACYLHGRNCPKDTKSTKQIAEILDTQFRFFLHLARQYAAFLRNSSDRIRAAKWMQMLCTIGKNLCSVQKGIRNDYLTVLAGYLSNKAVVGPFEENPPDYLRPLCEVAEKSGNTKPITDPTHPRTAEFFSGLPQPEEGAFAFIAVSGDLYEPKL